MTVPLETEIWVPKNDLDYSQAEYGHLQGVPAPRTLTVPDGALTHEQAMSLALEAAQQGIRGANPLVGAVITNRAGQVLHLGWHRGAGTPHAEADALAQARAAGTDLTGAKMYVTLEPCHHTGRTGPCSHALKKSGIAQVFYAYPDTSEQASGGAEYLRSHGVPALYFEEFASASYELNERWFISGAEKRPFMTAKTASTLDGFIAAADGSSKWITGVPSRSDGHLIRKRADAVLVGTRTVLIDDPALDARDPSGRRYDQQPLRVVMGKTKIPDSYKVRGLGTGDPENYLQIYTHDPKVLLDELYARGIRHVMIEGGPGLVGLFAGEDLIDELVWYRAPILLGHGKSAVENLATHTLKNASRLKLDDVGMFPAVRVLGQDTATHLIPIPRSTPENTPGTRRRN